jgi:hypothetical protein
MESSNTNHEDKDHKGNINIPLVTSALGRKMLEYIAAQTQVREAMVQTMVTESSVHYRASSAP